MSADKLAEALRLARGRVVSYLHQQEAYGDRPARCEGLKSDLAEIDAALAAHEAEKQEPVAWAITYDGKTPHVMWPFGNAGIDAEIKRIGGSASKMALYLSPQQEPDRLAKLPLPVQDACDIDYCSGSEMGYAEGWNDAIDAAKEAKP